MRPSVHDPAMLSLWIARQGLGGNLKNAGQVALIWRFGPMKAWTLEDAGGADVSRKNVRHVRLPTKLAVILVAIAMIVTAFPLLSGLSASQRTSNMPSNVGQRASKVSPSVTSYPVIFDESGLPTGTSWSVVFNSVTNTSTTADITFEAPNGTYSYSVLAVKGYVASPSSGSVVVNGSGFNFERITFTQAYHYTVTVNETGLPTGALWTLTFNGSVYNETTAHFTSSPLPNGTYAYSVAAVPAFTAAPSSGSLTVNGKPTGVNITFTPVKNEFLIIFKQSGLGSGVKSWSVTYNGSTLSATPANQIDFASKNGSNAYTVGAVAGYTAKPASGAINVTGASVTTSITFSVAPGYYTVTFHESGLATGTSWSVTFNGNTSASTRTTDAFIAPNGTFAFTVKPITGYSIIPSSSSLTVAGASVSETILFISPGNFTVTFVESGLPNGYKWYVSLGGSFGRNSVTAPAKVVYVEPDGTYTFAVTPITHWIATPEIGNVTVSGANVSTTITWAYSSSVIFGQTGLTGTYSWTATLNSVSQSSATASMTFNVTNGTYSWNVTKIAGYNLAPVSGTISVAGKTTWVNVTFSKAETYSVTFSESGLVSGTTWNVTLNGSTSSSTGSIVFTEKNGTIPFTVGKVANYAASPASGNITVNGKALFQTINFTKVSLNTISSVAVSPTSATIYTKATQSFSATPTCKLSACPSGVTYSWWLANSELGTLSSSSGASTSFTAGTGTGVETLYVNATLNGTKVVSPAVTISISTAPPVKETYTVTVTESGLASGTTWGITLNGTLKSSTSTSVSFSLINGTYSYNLTAPSGYTASKSSGSVVVAGSNQSLAITFSSSSTSSPSSSSNDTTYIIIGVVAAVVVVGAVAFVIMKGKKKGSAPQMEQQQQMYQQDPNYQYGNQQQPPYQ